MSFHGPLNTKRSIRLLLSAVLTCFGLLSCVSMPANSSVAKKVTVEENIVSVTDPYGIATSGANATYITSGTPVLDNGVLNVNLDFIAEFYLDSATVQDTEYLRIEEYIVKDEYFGFDLISHTLLGGIAAYGLIADIDSKGWRITARAVGGLAAILEYMYIVEDIEELLIPFAKPEESTWINQDTLKVWTTRGKDRPVIQSANVNSTDLKKRFKSIDAIYLFSVQDRRIATMDKNQFKMSFEHFLTASPLQVRVEAGGRKYFSYTYFTREGIETINQHYFDQGNLPAIKQIYKKLSHLGSDLLVPLTASIEALEDKYAQFIKKMDSFASVEEAELAARKFSKAHPFIYENYKDEIQKYFRERSELEAKRHQITMEIDELEKTVDSLRSELSQLTANIPPEPIANSDFENSVVISGQTIGVMSRGTKIGDSCEEEHEVSIYREGRAVLITFSIPFSVKGQMFDMRVKPLGTRDYLVDEYIRTVNVYQEINIDGYDSYKNDINKRNDHLSKITAIEQKVKELEEKIIDLQRVKG